MKTSLRSFGLFLIMLAALALGLAHAQDAQPKPEPAAPASSQQPEKKAEPRNPNAVVGRELVEASKAAEGEPEEQDQTTGLKHSSAVRWIAKTAGVSVETAYWIAMFINFAIVFGAIGWVMKSKLPGYFKTRNETIQKGILEARAASEDAKRRLADIESRLSKLDVEVSQIKASAETESAAEETRIRAAAEAEVKRILESAEQEIEAASRQARRDLKGLAAGLAVDLAERKLQIDQMTDESLVRNFVAQLGKGGR